MTKKAASATTTAIAAPVLPSIDELRRLDAPMRRAVELLDDNVRRAHDRICADSRLSPADAQIFVKASITVVLSVAASLLETAQERRRETMREEAFGEAARDALRWARARHGAGAENAGESDKSSGKSSRKGKSNPDGV